MSELLRSQVKQKCMLCLDTKLMLYFLHHDEELLIIQINEETIKQHGEKVGTVVSDNLQKSLTSDFKNLAVSIW